jgi:ABC-type amino acid transport substrate-binding protein
MQDLADEKSGLLPGVKQTLKAGTTLATATEDAIQALDTYTGNTFERLVAAGKKPADVADIRALMGDIAQTAQHLQGLADSLNAFLLSPGWEQRLPQLLQVLDRTEQQGDDMLGEEWLMWFRQMYRWRTYQVIARGVMLVALLLGVMGCQPEPIPKLLDFDPPSPAVHAGESMYLRLTYDAQDARLGNFTWTVQAGTIVGDSLSAVLYQAPPTPGTYDVAVSVAYGSRGKAVSLATTIQVLPAPAPVAKAPPTRHPTDATSLKEAKGMIDRILHQGRLRVAVYDDFAPFSFLDDNGTRQGFDIDLMRECARRWLGDARAITFVAVQAGRRIPTLLEGKADIIAAALTNTPSRQQNIVFSHTYFKDGQRLLVPEHAEVTDVCDLAGKSIVLPRGSTAVVNIKSQLDACGVTATLVEVDTHAQAVEAVLTGEADAFSSDGLALGRWAQGRPLKVVGNHFSEEPYGLGLPQGEDNFRRLVNLTLEMISADGTLAKIYYKWFQDNLRPYPISSVATDAAEPVLLKLAHTELPSLFPSRPESVSLVKEYTVKRGDTLSRLSGKFYGDVSPVSWKRIYAANKENIGPNPSRLRLGMQLRIPPQAN